MADTKKKIFGLNLEKITFTTNWATIVALFGLLTACAYLYVVNQEHQKDQVELQTKIESLETRVSAQDSLLNSIDHYVVELLKKSSELSEYDGMIFYKDLYFENRFRKIDGKSYLEFIPDKMDFYKKTMPGAQLFSSPSPMLTPVKPPVDNTN